MEIYEMIDLQDCPRCFGPSILEEEDHGYYVDVSQQLLRLRTMMKDLRLQEEQQSYGTPVR